MSVIALSEQIAVSPLLSQTKLSNSVQLTDGTIVVSYTNLGGGGLYFQRFSNEGVAIGAPTTFGRSIGSAFADNPQSQKLAALSDGGFVLALRTPTEIFSMKFDANGAAVGPYVEHTLVGQFDFSLSLGDVAALPGGGYVVTYGKKMQVVAKDGTVSPAVEITTSFGDTDVTVNTDHISVVIDNNGGKSVKVVTTDLVGNNIQTSVATVTPTAALSNANATLADGSFVSVYCYAESLVAGSTRSIKAVVTSSDGATVLTGETVIADNIQNVFNLDVKGLANGGYAICYNTVSGSSANVYETYLSVYSADGTAIGSPFLLDKPDAGFTPLMPELTNLTDGRLLITWTQGGQASGFVKMQILDPLYGYQMGTSAAEIIRGADGRDDDLHGGAGRDTIYGLSGADALYGDQGTDALFGGSGDDTVRGGADSDYVYGDFGDDKQYGDSGNDVIYAGAGSDLMDGGIGSDTAYYSNEKIGAVINLLDQSLNAGSATGDTLVSIERIFGSNLAGDNITADAGNNTLLGNGGNDTLSGGAGIDILRGGAGTDTLDGGTGADFFQYTNIAEVGDTIVNFETADSFQFTRAAFGNLAGATLAAANFLSVTSGHVATTATQRFIYDQALDQLWYDADGNAGGAAVMVADLTNDINVTNLDLLLV